MRKSKKEKKLKVEPTEKKVETCEITNFEEVQVAVTKGWKVIEIKSEIKPSSLLSGRPKTWVLKREA